jgi:DNA-binding response OmpR family regulator
MGQDLVLVVDDDLDLQDMLEFVLHMANCRVLRAASGRVALELLRGVRPALVLLDLMLPDMRGEEVFQQIRALPGEPMPVVLMSAAVDVTLRADRLGVPCLAKPFDVECLMELVQRSCTAAIDL